jgi:ADP-heptose:LPS heptosyltransferase
MEKRKSSKKKFDKIKSPISISEIKDKKILIWDEQGLGDTINFSRFVIDILKFTKKITFAVDKKLKEILSNLDKEINVVDYESFKETNYDFQIALGSLPKLLNITTTDDINFYKLSLPEKKIPKKYIDNDKFNIGLAWSGNPNYPMDKYRSISFEKFDRLTQLKKFNFYKLSKTVKKSISTNLKNSPNIFDFGDRSLFEISEIIKELDLVISADTSINHLAGILGINSILLLNFNNYWTWFNDDNKNQWYPSVKIIKQTKFNSWDEVFENLIIEVEKIYKKKG